MKKPAESANSSTFMAGKRMSRMAAPRMSRLSSGVGVSPCRAASAAAQLLAAYAHTWSL